MCHVTQPYSKVVVCHVTQFTSYRVSGCVMCVSRLYSRVSVYHVTLFCALSAYVLQVKVEMELEIQQCEKAKAVREEQLERLTQICQEQAVSPITLPLRPVPVITL